MWKCSNCGCEFAYPDYDHWSEYHGQGIYEPWCSARCPCCGSEDIEEDIEDDFEEEDE